MNQSHNIRLIKALSKSLFLLAVKVLNQERQTTLTVFGYIRMLCGISWSWLISINKELRE